MSERPLRRPDYYAGSNWLRWSVWILVVGVLVFKLEQALDEANAQAERLATELTVRNMRTGLQLATGEALMHGKEREIETWVGTNPVEWLGVPPSGYIGECVQAGRGTLSKGEWCFDSSSHELAFRPRHSANLSARSGSEERCDELRWWVTRAEQGGSVPGLGGLRIERANSCGWRE